jgi:hypothetical protein
LLGPAKLAQNHGHIAKAGVLLKGAIRYGKEAFGDDNDAMAEGKRRLTQVEERIAAEHMEEKHPPLPEINVKPIRDVVGDIRLD